MSSRIGQFAVNIGRAREMVGLGESVSNLTSGTVDPTDIYRAALVQGVAALDSYVHGVVLDHGVDIVAGTRAAGSKTQVGLHFGAVKDLLSCQTQFELRLAAISHVSERLSRETFQRPDDIARAFAMVGIRQIWTSAFSENAGQQRTALGIVVDRRNQIVHSCDRDPTDPTQLRGLSKDDAIESVETVRRITYAIDSHV